MTRTAAGTLALLALPLSALAQDNPWPERARGDLLAIHDLVHQHHPGPVIDPAFAAQLEDGLREAWQRTAEVEDLAGYIYLLMGYANGLPDSHLAVWGARDHPEWNSAPRKPTLYPGFVTAWRNEGFEVRAAVDAGGVVRDGMRLVACDGATVDELAQANLFAVMGKPEQPADWVRFAPLLMVDQGAVGFLRPERCTFADGEGAVEAALSWREVTMSSLSAALADAGTGAAPAAGARRLADGGLWVSLPSFEAQALPPEVADPIRSAIAAAIEAPYLVFDVRGNGGGNSILADSFAAAAFGADWVSALRAADDRDAASAALRASAGNRAYFAAARDQSSGMTRDYFALLVDAIDAAMLAGRPVATFGGSGLQAPQPIPEPVHEGPVFVLTDSNGFSSTLLLVDLLRRHPNAQHVGWPTRAHGLYGELRQERLPSGWAWLGFSTKSFPRPMGDGLMPDEAWSGEIDDTAGLEAWIAELAAGRR